MSGFELSKYDSATAAGIVEAMNSGIRAEDFLRSLCSDEINPYFPYEKIHEGYQPMRGYEELPTKLLMYLMDLPREDIGYEPPDDNRYPRCRMWKYLFYDDQTPLMNDLPTGAQKREVLFNPLAPNDPPDKDKGYRMYAQHIWGDAVGQQGTHVRISLGRSFPRNQFKTEIGIGFWIATSPTLEYLRDGTTRIDGIAQAIIESLHGVHIEGCGAIYFSREGHPDCGVAEARTDGVHFIARMVTMGLSWTW